ncbi:MAG: toprim domain-containing protein, partial [Clostridia bacterium]|nr:toprim domain-containing protein [Clostridia bacterium]
RNRVMFPVIDVRGNVVAFSGRVLDDSKPKYMNSPETLVYKKSQTVFGLNFAKQTPDNRIILVEGNLDVASLHQAGFVGAVAPLGTAFTKEQARMISKYATTVVVAFDMDKAGVKATDKAISYLEELGVTVRVLQMRGAKDPDEFIKKYGKVQFERLISGSKNPVQYSLDKLAMGRDLSDITDRTEYVRKAVGVVAQIPSDIERDMFAKILARQTDVSVESVRTEIKRARARYVKQTKQQEMDRAAPGFAPVDRVNTQRSGNLRAAKAEEGLIALLAKYPDRAPWLRERITSEEFITDFNRKVYEFFADKIGQGVDPGTLISAHFEAAEVARIVQILNTQIYAGDPMPQFEDYIRVIKFERNKKTEIGSQSPEALQKMLEQKKRSE